MSSIAMGREPQSSFGAAAGVQPKMKASARNKSAAPSEFEPRAVRGSTVQPPQSARTGGGPRARERLVQRPTTTSGDGSGSAGGGAAGGGGDTFVARQRKREELKRARLEARRQEIEQEEMSKPTPAPSGLAGRRRGGEGSGFEGGPPPSGRASGERPVSRGSARPGGTDGGRRARAGRSGGGPRSRNSSRNGSEGGGASSKAKGAAGQNTGPVHPQSEAGKALRAKKTQLKTACGALAIFRQYIKHDQSGRGQAAFDKLITRVPTELKEGEPSKSKKKSLTGETVVGALQALATYIQSNEDYGTSAFRELGACLPYAAAAADDAELIDYLATAGIDLGSGREGDGVTALQVACARANLSAIEALLRHAPDCVRRPDANGYTALLMAAEDGDWTVGRALLSHAQAVAPDVDWALPDGTTALIIAAENGEAQFIELMIDAGADLDAALNDGTTALFMAAQEKHADVCGLLLTACDTQVVSAYANRARHDGFNAFMIAAGEGSWECTELLLRAGADVNASTKDGSSAILMAAQNGHDIVVELLIRNGADVNCERNDGVTPLQAALEGGHEESAALLVAAGAKV
jgi:ankyrin repeat protein